MSEVMIHRHGRTVGGFAAILSLIGSMLWAGAQYKAILSLLLGLKICPIEVLEPMVALVLLLWSAVGGLMADVWLDALSMLVVAPTMAVLAVLAWKQLPDGALKAEQLHALSVAPSLAANKFAVGLFGNLFTEELAGRVLSARTERQAKVACLMACVLFGTIGLAPAILGTWSKHSGLLKSSENENVCDSQDQVIGMAGQQLLPPEFIGKQHILVAILILESLNTVDTSILMCAKVMANQARRYQLLPEATWADHATVACSLAVVIGVSKLGDNVWDLAEEATECVGAPLALLCTLIPFQGRSDDRFAAGFGAILAQATYVFLKSKEDEGMPFLWAILGGGATYALLRFSGVNATTKTSSPLKSPTTTRSKSMSGASSRSDARSRSDERTVGPDSDEAGKKKTTMKEITTVTTKTTTTTSTGSTKKPSTIANPWNQFQHDNRHRGWTMQQMSEEYDKWKRIQEKKK
eukprot:Skav234577  [mRNA]  locus=scaffold2869:207684:209081:- [translate_table: standard]